MSEIKPVAYFKATEKHGILWGEDCCCVDPVYGDYEDHEGQEVVNLAVYPVAAYEALQKENQSLKESNLELERLCDTTYVKQGADAYNHCCEVFEAWRVKRQKLDLPTHDWADGLYNSLNWLQDTIEELEAESAAQAKRIEEAVSHIKDMLENDDGQAHKEARKFIESLLASKNGE